MQEQMIKRMTENEIKEWLVAIDNMIEHYKGGIRVDECPFCHINPCGCDECLWKIIEEQDCEVFADKFSDKKGAANFRNDLRNKKWRTARLEQLPRWKKIMQAEVIRRAEVGA